MGKRAKLLYTRRPGSTQYYENFTVHGDRFRGSLGTDDESEAAVIAAERWRAAVKRLSQPEGQREITLDEAIGAYWLEAGQHAVSAIDIKRRLDTLRSSLGASVPLARIGMPEIVAFVAQRRGTVATGRETLLSPSTVNRELTLLRAVLHRARDVHGVALAKLTWSKLFLIEPDERETILSEDDEDRLFRALRPDYWPLVSFAILSGQRLANCLGLRWDQVDWSRRVITFRIKSRKPGGRVHVVPISDAIAAVLSVERGRHPEMVFTYECQRTARHPVGERRGKRQMEERRKGTRYPFSPYGWRRPFLDALKAAGLSEARFHDLRHTAATRALAGAGGNLKVVQRLLGHADVKTTLRYLRASVDDVRAALDATQSASRTTEKTPEKDAASTA